MRKSYSEEMSTVPLLAVALLAVIVDAPAPIMAIAFALLFAALAVESWNLVKAARID